MAPPKKHRLDKWKYFMAMEYVRQLIRYQLWYKYRHPEVSNDFRNREKMLKYLRRHFLKRINYQLRFSDAKARRYFSDLLKLYNFHGKDIPKILDKANKGESGKDKGLMGEYESYFKKLLLQHYEVPGVLWGYQRKAQK